MNFVAHTDALIFDLRENHGGDPNMVDFMVSYLFQRPTHINDLTNRHVMALLKHAVEDLFNVRVQDVRTQMRKGKKRRYRSRVGRLANWKKAIVKLHPEDRIEFF